MTRVAPIPDERPTEQEDADVRAQRGDQGAGAVDAQAYCEDPSPALHVAELRPGEHEGRHHEGVGRDRQLHRRNRRVEVVDHLGDRDVHDGRVQHHHELGGSEWMRMVARFFTALARRDGGGSGKARGRGQAHEGERRQH